MIIKGSFDCKKFINLFQIHSDNCSSLNWAHSPLLRRIFQFFFVRPFRNCLKAICDLLPPPESKNRHWINRKYEMDENKMRHFSVKWMKNSSGLQYCARLATLQTSAVYHFFFWLAQVESHGLGGCRPFLIWQKLPRVLGGVGGGVGTRR